MEKNCENCQFPYSLCQFEYRDNPEECPLWELDEESVKNDILLGYLESQSPE